MFHRSPSLLVRRLRVKSSCASGLSLEVSATSSPVCRHRYSLAGPDRQRIRTQLPVHRRGLDRRPPGRKVAPSHRARNAALRAGEGQALRGFRPGAFFGTDGRRHVQGAPGPASRPLRSFARRPRVNRCDDRWGSRVGAASLQAKVSLLSFRYDSEVDGP